MIFQYGIPLHIANRAVQAQIDLDTGWIGFTERIENQTIEYTYMDSPLEFKQAFIAWLETLNTTRTDGNLRISFNNPSMCAIMRIVKTP